MKRSRHLLALRVPARRYARPPEGEDGSSLVEAVVALALLLGVLVPSAAFLARLALQQAPRAHAQALALAEAAMEEALARPPAPLAAPDSTVRTPRPAWRVVAECQPEEGLLLVTVRVYRAAEPRRPLVVLACMRRP